MSEKNTFVLARANATRAAQNAIAPGWVWAEKTLAQWDADIAAFEAQNEAVTDAEAVKEEAVGSLDIALERLHRQTQVGLGLLKNKFRNDPARVHSLKPLTALGGSRSRITEEALDWESAWEKLAPAWQPEPTQTIETFKTLREDCLALSKAYSNKKSEWRRQVGEWNKLCDQLNADCIAWYSDAIRVFAEDTPQGDMIRSTIPTTYNPTELPEKAAITSLTQNAAGEVVLVFEAENATNFDILHKGPGQSTFTIMAEAVISEPYTPPGLPPGLHEFKVVGKNSRGAGTESDVAAITTT